MPTPFDALLGGTTQARPVDGSSMYSNLTSNPLIALGYGLLTSRTNPIDAAGEVLAKGDALKRQAQQDKITQLLTAAKIQKALNPVSTLQPVTLPDGTVMGYDKNTNQLTPASMAGQASPVAGNITTSELPPVQGGGTTVGGIGGLSPRGKYDAEKAQIDANAPLTRQQIIDNQNTAEALRLKQEKERREKEQAEAAANAKQQANDATLYGAQNSVLDAIKGTDELLAHPGFNDAVGNHFGTLAYGLGLKDKPYAGTDAAGFEARQAQLKGGSFLQAYQLLKGGGAITEVEGTKAENSLLRASQATSKQEYISAMQDYKKYITDGYNKIRVAQGYKPISQAELLAGGATKVAPAKPQPTASGGVKFLGFE